MEKPKGIKSTRLILIVALFLVVLDNKTFFSKVSQVYPPTARNLAFMASLGLIVGCLVILLLMPFAFKKTLKPVLIAVLMSAAIVAYFMDSYGVVIDTSMLDNVAQTSVSEARDLISLKLFLYLLFLGVAPSLIVLKVKIDFDSFRKKIIVTGASFLLIPLLVFTFNSYYASFFRIYKPLRYYTNPTYFIYSTCEFLTKQLLHPSAALTTLGEDARIPAGRLQRRLVILVVGETARADRFSLNGYQRETNPHLQRENVINFSQMYACGTSTAVALPCMFSSYARADYSAAKAKSTENLLDVLRHAGVNLLWRDNNSDSKGVALRIPYEDFTMPEINPVCDVECRDEGMLAGLQQYIDNICGGDLLIVLHQMGNHGPEYFKRYPAAFEKFKPTCITNQFQECSSEEINNAYDNAILYTDYFLSQVIELLQRNTGPFETAMVYLSDHGESLGERGVYLHGLPYFMAPENQTHVPAVMWFGENFPVQTELLRDMATETYSHDNLFHTLLGLFDAETNVYQPAMDIVRPARINIGPTLGLVD